MVVRVMWPRAIHCRMVAWVGMWVPPVMAAM